MPATSSSGLSSIGDNSCGASSPWLLVVVLSDLIAENVIWEVYT